MVVYLHSGQAETLGDRGFVAIRKDKSSKKVEVLDMLPL
jgi:hypothetical protein